MKQDVIIRWLMENVDAEQLAHANESGTTISYYAGVAQRFPANELQANNNTRRPARATPTVAEERDEQAPLPARRQPTRTAAVTAVDLNNQNETAEAPAPTRTTARRPARQTAQGEDRVRVGGY